STETRYCWTMPRPRNKTTWSTFLYDGTRCSRRAGLVQRRFALLVATYRHEDTGLRQLQSPEEDALALARVLRDPDIGGFEVTTLVNEPQHVVGAAIGSFYRHRRRDDLTLLYFTGHGVKDDDGRLYFAMTNTDLDSLLFTALSAEQINYAMDSCPSRQKVL